MKTITNDEKGFPFEVMPEAITTNFALFRKMQEKREELALALSKDIHELHKMANNIETEGRHGECVAIGFVSYAGGKAGENRWVSGMPLHKENISDPIIEYLRPVIVEAVKKCLREEPDDTKDIRSTSKRSASDSEETHSSSILWEEKGGRLEEKPDLSGKDLILESVFHTEKQHKDLEQPCVVL